MSNASGSGSEMSKRRALPGTSSAVVTPDLASLFECPVCFDYVLPPILQCQSGHLVCSSCRPKLTCCPTCRGPLGNIRNLAMEKVASTVMFPCKYAATGCSVLQLYSEKVEHEEICEFRPFQCPCPGASCKWLGSLDQVMPHLVSSHKSITTLQGEDIVFLATDINLPGAVDWVMMQSCFGHCFMLVLEKQEKFDGHQQFFALVQLIGSRKQAENFGYRLELNRQRRRLTWEATPRSIHEGIATAIVSSDCLVFDTSVAQLFADNGNLGINIIKVTSENIAVSDLLNLLVSVNKKIAVNCLKTAGYELKDSDYVKWIHFTTKNKRAEDKVKMILLNLNVSNTQTKFKETQMTAEKYYKLILNEVIGITESKRVENSNKELTQNLIDTSFKLSLIQIKTSQFVNLQINDNLSNTIKTACKRAIFLQYNISRLVAIRKKYLEIVAEGRYPTMPSIEKLDFTYLKEPEEWCLLFNFLLEYPSLIEKVADDFLKGKTNSLQIFNFLSNLCSLYSTYYRRVRVLLEPKTHLLTLVFTRLVLAEAIEQILENGLALLDIKKIDKM